MYVKRYLLSLSMSLFITLQYACWLVLVAGAIMFLYAFCMLLYVTFDCGPCSLCVPVEVSKVRLTILYEGCLCNLITMHVYFSTTELLKSVLCCEKLRSEERRVGKECQ